MPRIIIRVIERLFIPPAGALPHCGAKWFCRFFADRLDRRPASFESILVLVPTRAAAKSLRTAILGECVARGVQAVANLAISTLEDELAKSQDRNATPTAAESTAVWLDILRRGNLAQYTALFPSDTPQRADLLNVVGQIASLQKTLAENLLTISQAAERLADTPDAPRWHDLSALEKIFSRRLAEAGKIHPAQSLSNAVEAAADGAFDTLVSIGNPDVSVILKKLETAFEAHGKRVISAVFECGNADMFDKFGTPLPEPFAEADTLVADAQIRLYPDIPAEAAAVAELAESYGAANAYNTLSVACEQKKSVEVFRDALAKVGVNAVSLDGESAVKCAVGGLLQSFADYLEDGTFANFRKFAQNPLVLSAFEKKFGKSRAQILSDIDFISAESVCADTAQARDALLAHVFSDSPDPRKPRFAAAKYLRELFDFVDEISAPAPRGQSAVERIEDALSNFPPDESDALQVFAADVLKEAFAEIAAAEKFANTQFSRTEILTLASRQLNAAPAPQTFDARHLPLRDWMEIFWSDAPHVVLCDMNDGTVPLANADGIFLNDSIRRTLGMRTQAVRRARDAYMLAVLAKSRGGEGNALSVCIPRADTSGEPLRPSRILFQTQNLPERVKLLFAAPKNPKPPTKQTPEWKLRAPLKRFERKYSASCLNTYLGSPWQFYLQYVLGMEDFDPQADELDAAAFGSLFHKTLFGFAQSPESDSPVPERVRAAMLDIFEKTARDDFGKRPRAQVRLQLENLRGRISAVAGVQAQHRALGWKISAAEKRFETEICGKPFAGIFDRIDINENDGSVLVLDYKTYDKTAKSITKTKHVRERRDGSLEWDNLQMPLYFAIAKKMFAGRKISCGFFVAPKDTESTAIDIWDDIENYEQSALEKAAETIDAIENMRFEPLEKPRFDNFDDVFKTDFETLKQTVKFDR